METRPTRTYVFLDLETSGLPYLENNPTKITEIACVSVSRDQIVMRYNEVSKENDVRPRLLPRVLNKINFTVYPNKAIQPMASVVSGLTNENLEQEKPFDENLHSILTLYLERLEKPICLVAHNGNRFDFPILQSELAKIGKNLPEDIFCADSLPGFRKMMSDKQMLEQCNSSRKDGEIPGIKPLDLDVKCSSFLPKCGWSNEEYEIEMAQATELAEKFTQESDLFDVDELESKIKLGMEHMRKINESTPVRKNRRSSDHSKSENGVRRKILSSKQTVKKPNSLKSLYENLTGRELIDAHRAEGDAQALLECVIVVGRPFLEWIDSNRIPFRSIKKMW